jgi:hypothetical protein
MNIINNKYDFNEKDTLQDAMIKELMQKIHPKVLEEFGVEEEELIKQLKTITSLIIWSNNKEHLERL